MKVAPLLTHAPDLSTWNESKNARISLNNSTSDERVKVKMQIDEPGQVGEGDISELTDNVVRRGAHTGQKLVFKSVGGDCGVSGNVEELESECISFQKCENVPDPLCVAK